MEKNKGEKGEVSRRDFLIGAGAVVVGGAVGAGITYPLVSGGDGEVSTVTKTVSVPTTVTKTVGAETVTTTTTKTVGAGETVTSTVPGPTKTVTTTVGDGVAWPYLEPEETFLGTVRSPSAVDVKNGRIVRVRPLHYDSKYPELKDPWTMTARGKTFTAPMKSPLCAYALAYRKRTDSPNRILYPLKRVDWEPGGDPAKINAQNRGKSKYKKISWDEATTIIANELTRVAEKYGTSSISNVHRGSGGWTGKVVPKGPESVAAFLHYWLSSKYGTTFTEESSFGTTYAGGRLGGQFVWGYQKNGYEYSTGILQDISDNTEMILAWACDSLTKTWGSGHGALLGMIGHWYGELGIKRVYITPHLNRGAGIHNDKWIPVMCGTDPALYLAIAYTWITEDTYDQDYLDTHSVGFDKWKAYVMGDEDGIPKTPEWASPLCAVPEWTIKALARQWASKTTSTMYGRRGGQTSRGIYGHESNRMGIYLLAMQGWGAPGKHQCGNCALATPGSTKPPSVSKVAGATTTLAAISANLGLTFSSIDRDRPFIPQGYFYNCMFNPPVEWWHASDPFYKRTYPMEGESEIHMIWCGAASWSGGATKGNEQLKAFSSPKLECVVGQNIYMEDGTVFMDIILPIADVHEVEDITSTGDSFTSLIVKEKVIEPKGESKSDPDAVAEVAKKLDFFDEYTQGKTAWDWVREGYEISGWQDLVSWEELTEKRYFCQPPDPDWDKVEPSSLKFYEDPINNPLVTPSGLLEFESQDLEDNFPDDQERLPVAHYVRGGPLAEGWTHDEDRFLSENANKYPLLVVSNTRDWGMHSQHTDIPWTREIRYIEGWDGYWYSPLMMNPVDAAARGIEDGDIVRFYNDRGSVLAGAVVTEQMMPGNLSIDEAGGGDYIIPAELNRGGNPNSINDGLCSKHGYGLAAYAFLVEVEKVTGNQMDEWRKNYPEAFARDYIPAYGPIFTGWVEGGM